VSSGRRKDLRRKLKSQSHLTIEQHFCGSHVFNNDPFLDELYGLYLNVYNQSKYHFDLLSKQFFTHVLQDSHNGGVVFTYSDGDRMIGFNLCFLHRDNLVDKYIGFRYPEAKTYSLYFVSWFQNIEFALKNGAKYYIAGWTDPEVKAALGASFTMTYHAVYVHNTFLRLIFKCIRPWLTPDEKWSKEKG